MQIHRQLSSAAFLIAAFLTLPAAASADTPTFSVAPPASTNAQSLSVEFSFPAATGYTCTLDAGANTACTSPYLIDPLAEGAHTLSITATYMTNEIFCIPMPPGPPLCTPLPMIHTSDPLTANFIVDRTGPVVTVIAGQKQFSTASKSSVYFSLAAEAGSSFTCALDKQPLSACANPARFAKLKAGVHSFRASATDATGNVGGEVTRTFAVNSKRTSYKFVAKNTKVKKCTKRKHKRPRCTTKKL